MPTMTVPVITDSYVDEDRPGHNFGQAVSLWVNANSGASKRRYGLINPARPFDLAATVSLATLRLTVKGAAWTGDNIVTIKRVTGKWTENRANWNNRPAVSATNAATFTISNANDGDEFEWDLTDMFGDVASGDEYRGLRIEVDTNGNKAFYSSDAADASVHPELEVAWSINPDAPTDLSPSGGQVISLEFPILSFSYLDPTGEHSIDGLEVEIDTVDTLDSGDYWTSTPTPSTKTQLDLSDTDFLGFNIGTTWYWRVRVTDDAGITSGWSDTASLVRRAKGALVITAPGATVATTSPTATHTFSTTQESSSYALYKQNADGTWPSSPVWSREKTTNTDLSLGIPAGYITSETDTYRLVVRVWDNYPRVAAPGDLPYVEDSADFTYVPGGTATDTTSLLVTSGYGPGVDLAWNVAVEPDAFALIVDGEIVMDEIDPADVFVSGTSYAMSYYGASPGVSHTFEIRADDSNGNDTTDFTTAPTGIWLIEVLSPTEATIVVLAGGGASFPVGGEKTSFAVSGGRVPVLVTDSTRGLEGDVSGSIYDDEDTGWSAEQMKTRLESIIGKENTTELRVCVGSSYNVPIQIGPGFPSFTPIGKPHGYDVSIPVQQIGEFFQVSA